MEGAVLQLCHAKISLFHPCHHASSRMITTPFLHYVTPDIVTPLYHLFLFFEVEKKPKVVILPMTHPPMFLSN